MQGADSILEDPAEWRTVTEREPGAAEREDLAFAWKAAKHIKSNAIVFAKDRALVGMGAGQPNRVVSVHLSQRIAGDKAKGSVLASDAFFPFPDNIELAAEAGVTAIVQPGARCATRKSSLPPTRRGWRWYSRGCAISATSLQHAGPGL